MTDAGAIRAHGTAEDDDFKIEGGEFTRIMGYFSKTWALVTAIVLAIITGIAPISMNLVMGDMVNVVSRKGFSDADLNRVVIYLAAVFFGWSALYALSFGFRL